MLRKPKECKGCVLYDEDRNFAGGFSIPDGTCKNGVLIIGESLGENERVDAKPFRPWAEAGSVLNTAITKILGLNRNDFAYWNLVGCRPPFNNLENTKYEFESINHCKVHFNNVLNRFKPKVILACGNLPLKYLSSLHINNEITDKKKASITSIRGYVLNSIYNIPVIGTLHPSFINRSKRIYLGVLVRDLSLALEVAKNGVPRFNPNYIENPTEEQVLNFYNECKNNKDLPISYDIETPYTSIEPDESEIEWQNIDVRDIDSIQFSNKPNTGIFLHWNEHKEVIKAILALPNNKVGFNNWTFDQTNIEYHLGKGAIKGNNFDSMWLYHHFFSDFYKDRSLTLQYASTFTANHFPAWKHLSELEPTKYGIIDTDATLHLFTGLKAVMEKAKYDTNSKSLWQGYIDDLVNLRPILLDIQKRGLPIDLEEKAKFKKMLQAEIKRTNDEIQLLYPQTLRRRSPVLGYKNVPNEIINITNSFNSLTIFTNGNKYLIFEDRQKILAELIEKNTRIMKGKKITNSGLVLREFNIDGTLQKRWCRLELFKPNSKDQVINYIKFKKYKVPLSKTKDGIKETTSKDKISQLYEETGDVLFEKIIYIRELKKMIETYVDGWKTDEDGRVHTSFTFFPATGQLSSRNPNIQNSPARGTRFSSPNYPVLAKQFRKLIAAKEGKSILSADWSSFHALTLGFEAEDETYIRLVRCDIHSFVASYILKDELPNKLSKLKVIKGGRLSWTNPEEAKKLESDIDFLKDLDSWLLLSDEELKKKLAYIKENYKFTRDSQAKPAILGIGFGMGVNKFFRLNRYSFQNIEQPRKIHNILRAKFPKIFKFQEDITTLADKQGYLISRYGYIRRFYDVFDYRMLKEFRTVKFGEHIFKGKDNNWWLKTQGSQYNEAVAFYPANDAFGVKKEKMRELWRLKILEPSNKYQTSDGHAMNMVQRYGLINEIHDDLMFEVNDELIEECAINTKKVMESPSEILKNKVMPDGLKCLVEIKIGKDWASMESLDL